MVDAHAYEIVRQMGLSHAEFLHSLPAAAPQMNCRVDGSHIQISNSDRRVEIRLGPEQERRLGSLVLPQTRVSLWFEGFSRKERDGFLRQFDLAFQRGGG